MGNQFDLEAFRQFEVDGWKEVVGPYHRFFKPIVTRSVGLLLDRLGGSAAGRLLDLACGPGYVSATAQARGSRVVGVDFSREMASLAQTSLPEASFVEGDCEHLPFSDASFDAVAGSFVLPHLARPELAAEECARVLTPGGRVALSTWNLPSRSRYIEVFAEAITDVETTPVDELPEGPPFFRFADENQLAALLSGAGFGEIEIQDLEFLQEFESADVVWSGLLEGTARTGSVVRAQTGAVQEEIRIAFDRRMQEFASKGGFAVPVSIKIGTATNLRR